MAHFAQIDENGIVLQVLVVPDSEEDRGQQYLADDLLLGGTWIQTSFNRRIRKNFAGIGMVYDLVRDAFIPQKPFSSWILNEETCLWVAPIPEPITGKPFMWVEPEGWVIL